jgi:hypothetical protein
MASLIFSAITMAHAFGREPESPRPIIRLMRDDNYATQMLMHESRQFNKSFFKCFVSNV